MSAPAAFRSALKNPWWIPPFLGGVPDIDPALVRLLGLVSLAVFFEQYDNSMLTSALKFIAADLDMAENDLGGFLAAIKIGALPAFFVVPFADRIGRRRVFLISVLLFSLGTCMTGFAQNAVQFVLLQSVTRTFMTAAVAVALVIITEEFPAAYRGWAIGMFGALSSCGHGLGAGLFAAIEHMPFGWRGLYFVGVVPLLLLPLLRRGVVETARFHRHQASQKHAPPSRLSGARAAWLSGALAAGLSSWAKPIVSLARTHPARAFGIALVAGLFAIGESSVFQFTGYFTLTVHGWTPGQFSLMFILGGAVGIIGNVVAGRLGDRVGRRVVGFVFFIFFPLFAWIFYHGPSWSLPLAWTGFVFCNTAGGVIVRAFATELFPTSHRGTAAAWVSLVQTIGWAAGLWIVGLGTRAPGDIAAMTSLTSLIVLVAGVALLFLPETTRRELETISQESDEEAPPAHREAARAAGDGR